MEVLFMTGDPLLGVVILTPLTPPRNILGMSTSALSLDLKRICGLTVVRDALEAESKRPLDSNFSTGYKVTTSCGVLLEWS